MRRFLEIQPRFARGVGQRLDAAVIEIAAAIEDHVLDALWCARSAISLPTASPRRRSAPVLSSPAPLSPATRRRRASRPARRRSPAHRCASRSGTPTAACGRRRRAAACRARAPCAAAIRCLSLVIGRSVTSSCLPCGGCARRRIDALALVGLGRTEFADLGGDLADLLLVDAADHDLGRLRRRDGDAFRDRIDHVVAVAELRAAGSCPAPRRGSRRR